MSWSRSRCGKWLVLTSRGVVKLCFKLKFVTVLSIPCFCGVQQELAACSSLIIFPSIATKYFSRGKITPPSKVDWLMITNLSGEKPPVNAETLVILMG